MTTKREYIKSHPKSHLAKALKNNKWPGNTKIQIIGGLQAPDNPNSNLYKALATSKRKEYVIGGHRQSGADGWWMAVA